MAGLGDAAHGVAQPQLVVGGRERVGVADRDLLLSRPVLVDRLLDVETLRHQGVHDVDHHRRGPVEPRRGVDGPVAPRPRPVRGALGEVELVLERRAHADARRRGALHRPLQERARAAPPVEPVVADLVAEHARHTVEPRQPGIGAGVGDDADLPDRLHARDRDEVVEHVDRVLGAGQPDPRPACVRQPCDVHLLAAHHPARVAVEEPHEPHAVRLDALQQLPHRSSSPYTRRALPAPTISATRTASDCRPVPVRDPPAEHVDHRAPPQQRAEVVQLRRPERVGGEEHLGERRHLERLRHHRPAAGARVVHRQPDVHVDVREHGGQVAGRAVVGVAVQEQHRHASHAAQEPRHQRRVGAVHRQVRVAEADVELQRQARLDPRPQQVAQQHRVLHPAPVAEPPPRGGAHLRRGRRVRVEVEAVPVGHHRLEPDRGAGPLVERRDERVGKPRGGRPGGGHLLGHRLQAHHLGRVRPRRGGHRRRGEDLVGAVAGLDEEAARSRSPSGTGAPPPRPRARCAAPHRSRGRRAGAGPAPARTSAARRTPAGSRGRWCRAARGTATRSAPPRGRRGRGLRWPRRGRGGRRAAARRPPSPAPQPPRAEQTPATGGGQGPAPSASGRAVPGHRPAGRGRRQPGGNAAADRARRHHSGECRTPATASRRADGPACRMILLCRPVRTDVSTGAGPGTIFMDRRRHHGRRPAPRAAPVRFGCAPADRPADARTRTRGPGAPGAHRPHADRRGRARAHRRMRGRRRHGADRFRPAPWRAGAGRPGHAAGGAPGRGAAHEARPRPSPRPSPAPCRRRPTTPHPPTARPSC